MTNDAIMVLECLFENVWLLFTSWYIPGTDVTPAGAFMFFAFAGLALRFLYRLVGIAPVVDGDRVVSAAAIGVDPAATVPGKTSGSFSFKKE